MPFISTFHPWLPTCSGWFPFLPSIRRIVFNLPCCYLAVFFFLCQSPDLLTTEWKPTGHNFLMGSLVMRKWEPPDSSWQEADLRTVYTRREWLKRSGYLLTVGIVGKWYASDPSHKCFQVLGLSGLKLLSWDWSCCWLLCSCTTPGLLHNEQARRVAFPWSSCSPPNSQYLTMRLVYCRKKWSREVK